MARRGIGLGHRSRHVRSVPCHRLAIMPATSDTPEAYPPLLPPRLELGAVLDNGGQWDLASIRATVSHPASKLVAIARPRVAASSISRRMSLVFSDAQRAPKAGRAVHRSGGRQEEENGPDHEAAPQGGASRAAGAELRKRPAITVGLVSSRPAGHGSRSRRRRARRQRTASGGCPDGHERQHCALGLRQYLLRDLHAGVADRCDPGLRLSASSSRAGGVSAANAVARFGRRPPQLRAGPRSIWMNPERG